MIMTIISVHLLLFCSPIMYSLLNRKTLLNSITKQRTIDVGRPRQHTSKRKVCLHRIHSSLTEVTSIHLGNSPWGKREQKNYNSDRSIGIYSTVTELYLYFFFGPVFFWPHHVIRYRVWDGIIQPYLSVIPVCTSFRTESCPSKTGKIPTAWSSYL